jgi:hypothetical protein
VVVLGVGVVAIAYALEIEPSVLTAHVCRALAKRPPQVDMDEQECLRRLLGGASGAKTPALR